METETQTNISTSNDKKSLQKQKKEKSKVLSIVWLFLYFVLIVVICYDCAVIFHNRYYTSIYVHGHSMQPTLNNRASEDIVDIGISDNHESAKAKIKRFDVVTTFYNFDPEVEDDKLKIKRVWGFPEETISLQHDQSKKIYVFTVTKGSKEIAKYYSTTYGFNEKEEAEARKKYKEMKFSDREINELISYGKPFLEINAANLKTFKIRRLKNITTNIMVSPPASRYFTKTLGKNEYFVMGDNWTGSTDCYNPGNHHSIKYSDIQGVVVAIEGTAKLNDDGSLSDKHYTMPLVNF